MRVWWLQQLAREELLSPDQCEKLSELEDQNLLWDWTSSQNCWPCSKNPVTFWPFVDILTICGHFDPDDFKLVAWVDSLNGEIPMVLEDKLIKYIFILWNSHLKWSNQEEVVSNSFAEMKRCKRNTCFYWLRDVGLYNFQLSWDRDSKFIGLIGHKMNRTWGLDYKEVLGCKWNSCICTLSKVIYYHLFSDIPYIILLPFQVMA